MASRRLRAPARRLVPPSIMLLLFMGLAGCAQDARTAAPRPSATNASEAPTSPNTPSLASPHLQGGYDFVRAEPGAAPDLCIHKDYGGGCWVGAWDIDLAELTIHNTPDRIVVRLAFDPFTLTRVSGSSGESFWVLLDVNGDQFEERRIAFDFAARPGGLVNDWYGDEVPGCGVVRPKVDMEEQAITVDVPRRCLPPVRRPLRAQANFESRQPDIGLVWQAIDRSRWTAFAGPGDSATIADPTT